MSEETQKNIEETLKHKANVSKVCKAMTTAITYHAMEHDDSKMHSPELEGFTKTNKLLRGLEYDPSPGSEYHKVLDGPLKDALDHHYANNRHHPEYHKNGIDDMNLIDIFEMMADWKAATLRHATGDLTKSIELNAKRFNISPQLAKIMQNTVEFLDSIEGLEEGS